jgi:hypothetical protein
MSIKKQILIGIYLLGIIIVLFAGLVVVPSQRLAFEKSKYTTFSVCMGNAQSSSQEEVCALYR